MSKTFVCEYCGKRFEKLMMQEIKGETYTFGIGSENICCGCWALYFYGKRPMKKFAEKIKFS